MADVVSVDQFLDGWYPGWKPEHLDNPWLRMKSVPFSKADEERFWFVDFHWPRGFSPLGMQFVSDASWSTQLAAHQLPLPPAGGLVQRMGGPFLYEGEVPVTSPWEIGYRAARIEKNMPKFLQNFDAIWDERKWELELGLGYFESYDFAGKSLAELGQYMHDAWTLPAAGVGDPLRDHVPAAGDLPPALRRVRLERDRSRATSPRCSRAASTRSPRPTAPCGTSPTRPSGSASASIFTGNEAADIRGALADGGRQRLGVAHQVRRLPPGVRPPHRGHRRHEHPVVDRGQDVAARSARQLRRRRGTSRLRRRQSPPP